MRRLHDDPPISVHVDRAATHELDLEASRPTSVRRVIVSVAEDSSSGQRARVPPSPLASRGRALSGSSDPGALEEVLVHVQPMSSSDGDRRASPPAASSSADGATAADEQEFDIERALPAASSSADGAAGPADQGSSASPPVAPVPKPRAASPLSPAPAEAGRGLPPGLAGLKAAAKLLSEFGGRWCSAADGSAGSTGFGAIPPLPRSLATSPPQSPTAGAPAAAEAVETADGGAYAGQRDAKGEPEGRGVLKATDGNLYEGEFSAGVLHGFGKTTDGSGADTFEGDFCRGVHHGCGTQRFGATCEEYAGAWRDGARHGRGTYTYTGAGERREEYVGEWREGRREGRGTYRHEDGASYSGEWSGDRQHGRGQYRSAGGDVYEGEFENDIPHGRGTFRSAASASFEGEWWCLARSFRTRALLRSAAGAGAAGVASTFPMWQARAAARARHRAPRRG